MNRRRITQCPPIEQRRIEELPEPVASSMIRIQSAVRTDDIRNPGQTSESGGKQGGKKVKRVNMDGVRTRDELAQKPDHAVGPRPEARPRGAAVCNPIAVALEGSINRNVHHLTIPYTSVPPTSAIQSRCHQIYLMAALGQSGTQFLHGPRRTTKAGGDTRNDVNDAHSIAGQRNQDAMFCAAHCLRTYRPHTRFHDVWPAWKASQTPRTVIGSKKSLSDSTSVRSTSARSGPWCSQTRN